MSRKRRKPPVRKPNDRLTTREIHRALKAAGASDEAADAILELKGRDPDDGGVEVVSGSSVNEGSTWERESYACGVCLVPLNPFTTSDGAAGFTHARSWVEHDHDPQPVRASSLDGDVAMICDWCSETPVVYRYHGDNIGVIMGNTANNYGTRWVGCANCAPYIDKGDIEGLLDRILVVSPLAAKVEDDPPEVSAEIRRHLRRMQNAFIPTIHRREPLAAAPAAPVRPITPAMMPEVRKRLVRYWQDHGVDLVTRYTNSGTRAILPGIDAGYPEKFSKLVHDATAEQAGRFARRAEVGTNVADLYWVSADFTLLAIQAGKDLPDVNLAREQMPSSNGLVVYATPILHKKVSGRDVYITAIGWTLVPGGVWASLYCRPEETMPEHNPSSLKSVWGYLFPVSPGAGLPFGEHPSFEGDTIWRTLFATWFLMQQPGVGEVTEQKPAPKVRRAEARAGRGSPTVRVVDLRRHHRPATEERETSGGWKVSVRFMVRGHWKNQAYGPQRSLRKKLYISPFIKGPDGAPFKADPEVVKTLR